MHSADLCVIATYLCVHVQRAKHGNVAASVMLKALTTVRSAVILPMCDADLQSRFLPMFLPTEESQVRAAIERYTQGG